MRTSIWIATGSLATISVVGLAAAAVADGQDDTRDLGGRVTTATTTAAEQAQLATPTGDPASASDSALTPGETLTANTAVSTVSPRTPASPVSAQTPA